MPRPDPLAPGHIEGQNPATPERMPGHTADVESKPGGNEELLGGRPAFLFQAGEFAGATLDSSGANLPPAENGRPWQLEQMFTLGVRDVGPGDIYPEKIIAGIRAHGYLVWYRTTTAEADPQKP